VHCYINLLCSESQLHTPYLQTAADQTNAERKFTRKWIYSYTFTTVYISNVVSNCNQNSF
jgi:hypothetical protein